MTDRSYAQFCGVARALDVVGGRWTLLVVRNLLLGPRRYSTLLAELPGITTNVLAARLKRLEVHGIIERVVERTLEGEHNAWSLTAEGARLEPVVMELGRFGSRTMTAPKRGERVDVGWGLLSMKRRYRGGLSLRAELRVRLAKDATRVFTLSFTEHHLQVQDRAADAPDLVVTMSGEVFRNVVTGKGIGGAAEHDGAVVVAGTPAHWGAFVRALSLEGEAPRS